MILLPSRGRPHRLKTFLNCGLSEPGVLILDNDDDHNYRSVDLPDNWVRVVYPRGTIVQHLNHAFRAFPTQPWYALMADDIEPVTSGWDTTLAKACGSDKVAWGDDGIDHKPSHPFLGGDLVRAFGNIAHPTFTHLYVDTAWEMIAATLNCGVYLPEVKTTHRHWSNGGENDETYRNRPGSNEGVFYQFKSELPGLVAMIRYQLHVRPQANSPA